MKFERERPSPAIPSYKDPYALLGVGKRASAREIQDAFRKLAKEFHPDVRPNDVAAAERFKRMTLAYAMLSDETQRSLFDQGLMDMDGNERPNFGAFRAADADPFAKGREALGKLFKDRKKS